MILIKIRLDENVEVVTVPLDVSPNIGSTLPDTSSSTGANKVPHFPLLTMQIIFLQ